MTEERPRGFVSPNYTQVPNDLFDVYLPELKGSALSVLMVLLRETIGYHRLTHRVTVRKLAERTGLSKQGATDGADQLIDLGLIEKDTSSGVTRYTIIWRPDDTPIYGGSDGDEGVVLKSRTSESLGQKVGHDGLLSRTPSIKESSKERDIAADGGESLDEVFGPKAEADGPVSPFEGMTDDEKIAHIFKSGGRKFEKAPAHLSEILEEMVRVQVKVFDRDMYKDQRGQFLKAAKTFYQRYGSGMIEVYEEAARIHKREGLAYNGPQSVLWAVEELIHQDRKPPKSAKETSQVWAT